MAKRKTKPRFPEGVLSIEQIEKEYDGQWVIVEETHWNKNGRALAGRVLANSLDEESVVQVGIRYGKDHPKVRLFLFYAGEKIPEGCVVLL
jgi:hypothetical protein